mmetsp:Transcript_66952/g.150483  ORF Transcript_66952/g.150483 Transcript_66952/m.150483 type:complete len:235 (-) Transcript_66952:62-766(-)
MVLRFGAARALCSTSSGKRWNPFLTLQPFKPAEVLPLWNPLYWLAALGDKGPNKYFMKLHHPSLPGEKPDPSDREVYKSKLTPGSPVLVDQAMAELGKNSGGDVDNALGHATNIGILLGTLQGPGAKPNTYDVLQEGLSGELMKAVAEEALLAGARERIIIGPYILFKDLEWEVRLMWPAILNKVSFEVGGQPQEGGMVGISQLRAGNLVVRIQEGTSDDDVLVPCRADSSYSC